MQELLDYDKYHMTIGEEIKCLGMSVALSALAAWILYKHFAGLILCTIIFPIYCRKYISNQVAERKRELLMQFKDGIQSISVALLSGYSIENAWMEAEKELCELYGENAYMTREMHYMNRGIRMNQPVEELLSGFAERSGCEDIVGFAEIFRFAKRSGGNFAKILQNTVRKIAEKREVEREIETVLSGKKMEQRIMNVVPIGLLAYLNLTSDEFLAPLYGNIFGVCVMTGAFVAYIGAFFLACKMVEIDI